jgi:hypothetical protein
MALVAFDIEIAREIPDDLSDWMTLGPLGVACVALMREGDTGPSAWFNPTEQPDLYDAASGAMNERGLARVVDDLASVAGRGDTLVTWNGASFDFQVLANEFRALNNESRRDECARLALGSVDMMFWLVCQRGHPLALDTALAGMGLASKIHDVQLAGGDRSVISGKDAPRLWRAGEYEAVLTYCGGDVRRTLELAIECRRLQKLRWVSRRGTANSVPLGPRWPTVKECLQIPLPDTSWMTKPLDRQDFVGWTGASGRVAGSLPGMD